MKTEVVKEHEFDLIRSILNGDGSGYRVLVDRYSPMVFLVVRGFVKDEDEAEELAQQIFVKAYEKLSQFNMNSKFSTWLYSLALNHCRDYAKNIRRGNKRFSEMEVDFIDSNHVDDNTPYLKLEQKEWKKLLNVALGKLSEDYAEPFLLKYRDGLSYDAISEQMDVSVSALKVRVHRARKELKYLLLKQTSL